MIRLHAPVTVDRYIAAVRTILELRARPIRMEGSPYVSLEHIRLCLADCYGIRGYRLDDALVVPKYNSKIRVSVHGLVVTWV